MAAVLPPNLPDMRAAQRLLDVVDRLEAHLATTRPVNVPAELAFLRSRAVSLEGARLQAISRLDSLISRMEQQNEGDSPSSEGEAA